VGDPSPKPAATSTKANFTLLGAVETVKVYRRPENKCVQQLFLNDIKNQVQRKTKALPKIPCTSKTLLP